MQKPYLLKEVPVELDCSGHKADMLDHARKKLKNCLLFLAIIKTTCEKKRIEHKEIVDWLCNIYFRVEKDFGFSTC